MDHDIVIAALKVAGALLGGVLGVIGVLFNFKRSDNHVTGWGIVVIVGIVAAAAAGIFGSIMEGYKATSEAALQTQRTETLLRELSRVIQPITQLKITYWARIPTDAPGMRGYVDRIAKAIEADQAQLSGVVFPNENAIHVASSGKNGEPLTVDLGLHSRLWPTGKEPPVGIVALGYSINVFIKKKPVPPQEFAPVISTDSPENADWIAMSLPFTTKKRNRLQFNLRTKTVEIFGSAVFPKELWHSNGKLTSILDLHGAQLILLPPNASNWTLPPKYARFFRRDVEQLNRMVELKTIAFEFSEGRSFWINEKILSKTEFKGGYPAFSTVLPSDDAGFLKLVSRDE